MCVILIGQVSEELHEAAKTQNPHGFSCFTAEGGLIKSPSPAQVKKALNQFGVWHYRIKSSGLIDKKNIHPFEVARGNWLLYHNGIIGGGTPQMSDTNCLAVTLYNSPVSTVKTVLHSLSSGNRFALVNAHNVNEFYLYGKWECEAGVLMSHKMYYGSAYDSLTKSEKAGWTPVRYYGVKDSD